MRPSTLLSFVALLAAPLALANSFYDDDSVYSRDLSIEDSAVLQARAVLEALYDFVERRSLEEEFDDLLARGPGGLMVPSTNTRLRASLARRGPTKQVRGVG